MGKEREMVNEREHLAQADRHIAKCKDHIAHHYKLMLEIEQRGEDTSWAKTMLQTLKETLRLFEKHRQLIVERLKQAEQK